MLFAVEVRRRAHRIHPKQPLLTRFSSSYSLFDSADTNKEAIVPVEVDCLVDLVSYWRFSADDCVGGAALIHVSTHSHLLLVPLLISQTIQVHYKRVCFDSG